MKVETILIRMNRKIYANCPKCGYKNYIRTVTQDSPPQKGGDSCADCGATYEWKEVPDDK